MKLRRLLLSSVLSGGALAGGPFAATSVPAGDEVLRASDHKSLAKAVADYWEAKTETKGIAAAFDKVVEGMDKVEKKMKEGSLLAAVDDWEEVFWLATQRGLEDRKLKKSKATLEQGNVDLTYWVGKKYASSKGPAPLILIVPASGTDPATVLDAGWDDAGLLEEAILVVVHMQGDPSTWETQEGVNQVMQTFGQLAQSNRFGFDYDRVFLAGLGDGFGAAAATARSYPQLFAGLVGRQDIPNADPRNLRNMPTYIASDGEGAAAFAAKVEELGYGNCTRGEDDAAALWTWMQAHERDSYPTHLTFLPPMAHTRAAHWLKVDGINLDGEPRIDAVVDREQNAITIDADEISSVQLFFNDALVNLDEPIKVVVNGKVHEELGGRNRQLMVDMAYNQGDWGRVFTKSETYEVPEKPE